MNSSRCLKWRSSYRFIPTKRGPLDGISHAGVPRTRGACPRQTAPYKVAVNRDPQTRKPIYFVSSADQVPDAIPLLAGDTIQNLMSTLDHLAYQLVCRDTGDKPANPNWIYFPITDDRAAYEAKKGGKMQGASRSIARDAHRSAIRGRRRQSSGVDGTLSQPG